MSVIAQTFSRIARVASRIVSRALFLLCWAITVSSCGTTDQRVLERLDATTGRTLVTADEIGVFARTDARFSRSARDYLYVAPVEVNQQGLRQYYLWVGVASTLDHEYLSIPASLPRKLHMLVDDELVELALRPRGQGVPESGRQPLFQTPAALRAEYLARVSLYQIEMIGNAFPASISTEDGAGAALTYSLWNRPVEWRRFIAASRPD
jgi:hypothetical protein